MKRITEPLILELPFLPPSVNACFRSYKGRVIKSARLKLFEQQMIQHFADTEDGIEMIEGHLKLTIEFSLPNRRNIDIDNLLKSLLDSLEGVVFENDSEVYELQVTKISNTGVSKTSVKIEQLI
jgi:crossover junction endodeoxyribonuclease RusA